MNNKPIQTIRIGNIKATIWENQNTNGKTFFSTTLVQTYRDENKEWKESNNYMLDDLPKLELASRKAFEFIHSQNAERQAPESFTEKVVEQRKAKGSQTK